MNSNLKNLQKEDPLRLQQEVDKKDMGGLSPMSSPEEFTPSEELQIPYDDLHPFLKELIDEHRDLKEKISNFKKIIENLKYKNNINSLKDIDNFLQYFHQEFVPHNRKEESYFFPLLNRKLLKSSEHSAGMNPFTGIKVLLDDHVHAIRLGAILSNLLFMFSISEHGPTLATITSEILKNGKELVEVLELHIFREDNIALGLAHNLLTKEELDTIHQEFIN